MTVLTERFTAALAYATQIHARQVRKGTSIPYISHLLAVTSLALEHGATEDEAIAALLHDAVEDCGGMERLADVRQRFGPAVAEIVLGCSDTAELEKPPWTDRKRKYIDHLETASPSMRLVSACDKLHNARSVIVAMRCEGDAAWNRFKGGREGSLWYYRAILDVLTRRGLPASLLEELTLAVQEMHKVAGSKSPLSDVRPPDG
jgi:(p)ppGpp synthase/HD superfamily hydrolase